MTEKVTDAVEVLEEYKNKGERVDEVLFQIVTNEINRLRDELEKSQNKASGLSKTLHHVKQDRDSARVKWKDQMNYANRLKKDKAFLLRMLNK